MTAMMLKYSGTKETYRKITTLAATKLVTLLNLAMCIATCL